MPARLPPDQSDSGGTGKPEADIETLALNVSPVPGQIARQLTTEAVLAPGERIGGRYIVEEIPPVAGGYGIVYSLRTDDNVDSFVGKVPRVPSDATQDEIDQLHRVWIREAARAFALLPHANVLASVWMERATRAGPMLISEKVNGLELGEALQQRVLSREEKITAAVDIALALQFLWTEQGQPHLDVNLRNVLWGTNRTVRSEPNATSHLAALEVAIAGPRAILVDLGLSREVLEQIWKIPRRGGADRPINAKSVLHWSPEHFRTGQILSVEADFYSYGMLLLSLFGARLPLRLTSLASIEQFHASPVLDPDDVVVENRRLPWVTLIARCLRKNAARPFESWTELLAELPAALSDGVGSRSAQATRIEQRLVIQSKYQAARTSDARVLNAAESLAALGQTDAALAIAEKVLQRSPTSSRASALAGFCAMQLDDDRQAYQYLDATLRIEPSHSSALANRGLLSMRTQRWETALIDFCASLRVNELNVLALRPLIRLLVKLGKVDEAAGGLFALARLSPEMAQSFGALGPALWSRLGLTPGASPVSPQLALDAYSDVLAADVTSWFDGLKVRPRDSVGAGEFIPIRNAKGLLDGAQHLLPTVAGLIALMGNGTVAAVDSGETLASAPVADMRILDVDFGLGRAVGYAPATRTVFQCSEGRWKLLCRLPEQALGGHAPMWAKSLDVGCALSHWHDGANLLVIEPDGTIAWEHSVAEGADHLSGWTRSDGQRRIASSDERQVTVVDGSGALVWQYMPKYFTDHASYMSSDRVRPIVYLRAWRALVVGTSHQPQTGDETEDLCVLHCLSEDGALLWRAPIESELLRACLLDEVLLFVACSTVMAPTPVLDFVACYDCSGERLWAHQVRSPVLKFIVAERQRVIAVCADGEIMVFGAGGLLQAIATGFDRIADAAVKSGSLVAISQTDVSMWRLASL